MMPEDDNNYTTNIRSLLTKRRKGLGLACSYKNCGARYYTDTATNNTSKTHFFRFPKNKEVCDIWIKNSGRPDLFSKDRLHLYKNYRLCSRHFNDEMYTGPKKTRLLLLGVPADYENSVPSTTADASTSTINVTKSIENHLTDDNNMKGQNEDPLELDKPENVRILRISENKVCFDGATHLSSQMVVKEEIIIKQEDDLVQEVKQEIGDQELSSEILPVAEVKVELVQEQRDSYNLGPESDPLAISEQEITAAEDVKSESLHAEVKLEMSDDDDDELEPPKKKIIRKVVKRDIGIQVNLRPDMIDIGIQCSLMPDEMFEITKKISTANSPKKKRRRKQIHVVKRY